VDGQQPIQRGLRPVLAWDATASVRIEEPRLLRG